MVAKERRGDVKDSGGHSGDRGVRHGLADWEAVSDGTVTHPNPAAAARHLPHVPPAGDMTTLSLLSFTGRRG